MDCPLNGEVDPGPSSYVLLVEVPKFVKEYLCDLKDLGLVMV